MHRPDKNWVMVDLDLCKSNAATEPTSNEARKSNFKAAAFLTGIAGVSVVAGFSKTVMSAKKHDPSVFERAQIGEVALLEGGTRLAMRALAIGSLFAVVGVGGLCFTFWKLTGAKNMDEFTQKMNQLGPKVKRNNPPQSRSEFDGLTDLLKYVSSWGRE